MSLILSAAMLLEWLAVKHSRPEFDAAAKAIEAAIDAALQSPATRTADLGGKLGTKRLHRKNRRGDLSRTLDKPPDANPAALSVPPYCLPDR